MQFLFHLPYLHNSSEPETDKLASNYTLRSTHTKPHLDQFQNGAENDKSALRSTHTKSHLAQLQNSSDPETDKLVLKTHTKKYAHAQSLT